MTPEHEQQIRERLAAATDGPWFVEYESEECPPFKPYASAIHGPTMQGVLESQVSDDFKARYGHQMDEVTGVAAADAELMANAPTDLAALLAELDRLRAELTKAREITSEKVRYGGHAIWLEAETSLCGIHECRYYGDDGDADYSCQCARCEKTAQLYAHAVLGGGDT